jgi:rhodanese-related sulfurtransferase
LAAVALIAFAVTQMIEDKVNNISPSVIAQRPSYRTPAMMLLGFLVLFVILPGERSSGFAETPADQLTYEWQEGAAKVTSEKVVFDIMNERNDVVYIDLRPIEQYQRFTLPGAINMNPEEVLDRKYRAFFRSDPREKVFFTDGTSMSTQVWTIARRAGISHIHVLEGGLNGIFEMLFTEKPEEDNNNYMYGFSERFAKEARQYFQEGGAVKPTPDKQAPVHTIIEVQVPAASGGC